MPRKLTATTVVVLAVALAGCGKDDSSGTAAKSATTQTATATTPGTKTGASKTSGSKKTSAAKKKSSTSASKTSGAKKTSSAGSKTSGTATSGAATSAAEKKAPKKSGVVGVTPKSSGSGSGATDPSHGTGSGPTEDRSAVVTTLRRYYKAFIDKDGAQVCALLTSAGQGAMITDGGAKTCAASAERLIAQTSSNNIRLLASTRDGLHTDDITVTGNDATARIGKTSELRLVQENGKWLVKSPNVVQTRP